MTESSINEVQAGDYFNPNNQSLIITSPPKPTSLKGSRSVSPNQDLKQAKGEQTDYTNIPSEPSNRSKVRG